MKQSEKYFEKMDEYLMNIHVKDELAKQLKPKDENYAVPLAERMIDYENQIRKRVSSKSAVYFEKAFKEQNRDNLRMMDRDKRIKILALGSLIYNESVSINDIVTNIKLEQEELISRLSNSMSYPELPNSGKASVDPTGSTLNEYITPKQIENLRQYVSYIMKNSDSLPPEILSEANKNKVFEVLLNYNKKKDNHPLVKMGVVTDKHAADVVTAQIMG